MKGLMDRCLSQETMVGRMREEAETTKTEPRELYAWKEVQLQKFDMTRKSIKDSKKQTEALGNDNVWMISRLKLSSTLPKVATKS